MFYHHLVNSQSHQGKEHSKFTDIMESTNDEIPKRTITQVGFFFDKWQSTKTPAVIKFYDNLYAKLATIISSPGLISVSNRLFNVTTFSIIFGGKYEVFQSTASYMFIMEVNESDICDIQPEEQVKFMHHQSLEEVLEEFTIKQLFH